MIKPNTTVVSYLNGKKVDTKTLQARKDALLKDSRTEVHMYYEAPLTDAEKEAEHVQAIHTMNYFQNLREQWEDDQKNH